MKLLKKGIENIQFGYVCAGHSISASRIFFSKSALIFLHIIFLKAENIYSCCGKSVIRKQKIPFPFNQHEFTEFYGENSPRLSNNKNKAVNELIQSAIIN